MPAAESTKIGQWAFVSLPVFLLVAIAAVLPGCDVFTDDASRDSAVYPMYIDANANGVNDYVEASTHESATANRVSSTSGTLPPGPAPAGHAFVDEDGDGICDFAQNGSATWHGPGFVDENGNGICDYWDESSPQHHQHQGMEFQDHNDNQINDHFEARTHHGPGHAFVDGNGDGICDRAQDGSPTWHGPNFVDEDGDGRCDYWQPGGRGHGGRHHGGRGGM